MATIKFWSEMTKATSVDGQDKVMIGKNSNGEAMYVDFQYLVNQAGAQTSDYIPIEGNTLPTLGTESKFSIVGSGTYTQSAGGDVVVPENSLGIIVWDGDEWVLGSVITTPADGVVEEGNTEAVSGGEVWSSLRKGMINKGKSYPFVNQPDPLPARVITANDVILDFLIEEEEHDPEHNYTVTLLAKNDTSAGNWGNAIAIRRVRRSDGVFTGSYDISTTSETTSAADKAELNKMNIGGLQTISFYNAVFNKRFTITLDCDALEDGTLLDLAYTPTGNSMYLDGGVYKKVSRVQFADFEATKNTVDTLNSYNLNKGKAYPFINQPAEAVIPTVNNFILDAKIINGDYERFTFSVVAIYKNQTTFGNGIIIARNWLTSGARGYSFHYDAPRPQNITSEYNRVQVGKIALGGVQTLQLRDILEGTDVEITIDTDAVPAGYTSFGNETTAEPWVEHIINPANYLTVRQPEAVGGVPYFNTFREALVDSQEGLIQVGGILASSYASPVVFSGGGVNYKPSQVAAQYRTTSLLDSRPKALSDIIGILSENDDPCAIKSFGNRYIYFGTSSLLYRTEDELKKQTNKDNTFYEKLILDEPLPDSYRSTALAILNCFELDNGEILIEVRNGLKEDPESDWRGHRTQLYLTSGLKTAPRTLNAEGILEVDLRGLTTRVHQYKARTQTQGKTGTTISIHGSKIAISPYYIGRVGLVHYSNDFGQTWKVIFNMGVDDPEFAVPYKGDVGAWPLPEDLTPPMPANMWTEGGNSNFHVHGCYIDPYSANGRIWVATGDAEQNYQGRTALWYTDDEGETWTRMQTRGAGVLDSYAGLQPMGMIGSKNWLMVGSDSGTDGLYRWNRSKDSDTPILEPAYWHNDEYSLSLKQIYGGGVITDEGYLYALFHPNTPANYSKGHVVYSCDGVAFEVVYEDEVSDESGVLNIGWGSYIGKDRHGNIYIYNDNFTIIKLY